MKRFVWSLIVSVRFFALYLVVQQQKRRCVHFMFEWSVWWLHFGITSLQRLVFYTWNRCIAGTELSGITKTFIAILHSSELFTWGRNCRRSRSLALPISVVWRSRLSISKSTWRYSIFLARIYDSSKALSPVLAISHTNMYCQSVRTRC